LDLIRREIRVWPELLEEHPKELRILLCVRMVAHRQVYPAGLVHDALEMGESVEAALAVVASHAAVSYAAEAHVL